MHKIWCWEHYLRHINNVIAISCTAKENHIPTHNSFQIVKRKTLHPAPNETASLRWTSSFLSVSTNFYNKNMATGFATRHFGRSRRVWMVICIFPLPTHSASIHGACRRGALVIIYIYARSHAGAVSEICTKRSIVATTAAWRKHTCCSELVVMLINCVTIALNHHWQYVWRRTNAAMNSQ